MTDAAFKDLSRAPDRTTDPSRTTAVGVALLSAGLLMTELALTRLFSVTMYYHFAFLAISVALFGLSASGVAVFLFRRRLEPVATDTLLVRGSLLFALSLLIALACLVRLRVGLTFSLQTALRMAAIYLCAGLPFFTGGSAIAIALSRYAHRVNAIYAADLIGAAAGCLLLIPIVNLVGATGGVLCAAAAGATAAMFFATRDRRPRVLVASGLLIATALAGRLAWPALFDLAVTKGHEHHQVLFSKWNSFSRIGVYDVNYGDWSLSPKFRGALPGAILMDIDSAAATQILHLPNGFRDADYLRYELTALAYLLKGGAPTEPDAPPATPGFHALIIGTGGGRDLASALVLGAGRVDGAEINPIIVRDVMQGRFADYSGGVYRDPRVNVHIEDGRSFVRRSRERYDVIQASLVDTWAATTAGAYTLTENSLYTTDAFEDYLDHLNDDGVLTISRWMFDGLRLVSLAQEAFARRRLDPQSRIAIIRFERVMTMLVKREPFRPGELARLAADSRSLGFEIVYLPGMTVEAPQGPTGDFARLILAPDRHAFYRGYPLDITPVGDDRPFFFHTTRLSSQKHLAATMRALGMDVPSIPDLDTFATGGLSALVVLMGVSAVLVVAFVIVPLAATTRRELPSGWPLWLGYFGCLGAGFMLVEVALLQRFVLLLGHPVYSLTVTLFSLLLGTGIGATLGRTLTGERLRTALIRALLAIVAVAVFAAFALPAIIDHAIGLPLAIRLALAAALMLPAGVLMGIPLPSAVRLLVERGSKILVPWAWAINGVFSVVGSTLAVFVAMNWGFSTTLAAGGAAYLLAGVLVGLSGRPVVR